jgi:hypothetical protein
VSADSERAGEAFLRAAWAETVERRTEDDLVAVAHETLAAIAQVFDSGPATGCALVACEPGEPPENVISGLRKKVLAEDPHGGEDAPGREHWRNEPRS